MFVSSYGVAGLMLLQPPMNLAQAQADGLLGDVDLGALEEFDFEPTFPISVAWDRMPSPQDELHWLEEIERFYALDPDAELPRLSLPNTKSGARKALSWVERETNL